MAAFPEARLSEIDTAKQFPHENQIGAPHDFRPHHRMFCQRAKNENRTEVGIIAKQFAQFQQTPFRPFSGRKMIELRVADCAKHHCLGSKTDVFGLLGKRRSMFPDRRTANIRFQYFKTHVRGSRNGLQNRASFGKNFGADAVAGEECDFDVQRFAHCSWCCRSASKSRSSTSFWRSASLVKEM